MRFPAPLVGKTGKGKHGAKGKHGTKFFKDDEYHEDDDEMGDEEFDEEEGDGDGDVFCVCNQPSSGEMVACDNPTCKIEWFHFICVGLKKKPTSTWYCPECTKMIGK